MSEYEREPIRLGSAIQFPVDLLGDRSDLVALLMLVDSCLERARYSLVRYQEVVEEMAPPQTLAFQAPFVYAESFVLQLDGAARAMAAVGDLCERDSPEGANVARSVRVGELKAVRDSVQHADERVRGRARGHDVETEAIEMSGLRTPAGAIVAGNLTPDGLQWQDAKGLNRVVPITATVWEKTRGTSQDAIDAIFAMRDGQPEQDT